MSKSYYDILGVDKSVNGAEIKKAYRKLSLKYHPDKPGGDEERFKEINGAYEILSDEDKRRQYDMGSSNPSMGQRGNTGGFPSHLFKRSMSGHGGMPDIFASMFQGGGHPFQNPFMDTDMNNRENNTNVRFFRNGVEVNNQPPPPENISKHIKVTLRQCYDGASIPIDITRTIRRHQEKTTETETIYITIPVGIGSNEILTIPKMGNEVNDMKSDLKIKIMVEENKLFKRDGLNLIYENDISLKESLCGFSFELPFIDGKVYTINNNAGNIITSNFIKEIPNMGFTRNGNKGSLLIKFNIIFPTSITPENIIKLKEIL